MSDRHPTLETIANDIDWIKKQIEKITETLENKYVTKEEFWAVKTIVYTGASVILLAVLGAVINQVINK